MRKFSLLALFVFAIFYSPITYLFASSDTLEIASNAMSATQSESSNLLPVVVHEVKRGDISQQLLTSGDIYAFQAANLYPKTAGEITDIFVQEGSIVEKGDLLAEIDHRIQDAQLEQAKTAVAVAKASLEVQKVMLETSKSSLLSAKAQADVIKVQLTNLASTKNRLEQLFKEGAISLQQLDDITAQHDSAQANLISAQSNIIQAENGIETNKVTLSMREAQLLQAESNLLVAKVQHDNAFLKAPFSGIISMRAADPGDMANMGQPLFKLEDISKVKITGSLVEKDLLQLKKDATEAYVKIDAFNQEFSGIVYKIYPSIDIKTRTGQFEVLLNNPNQILRPGMYASIKLYLKTIQNALVIPKDVLLSQNGNRSAIRVDKDSIARRVYVKVGITQSDNIEILEGLDVGDLIVSQGAEFVRTGTQVKPVREEERQ